MRIVALSCQPIAVGAKRMAHSLKDTTLIRQVLRHFLTGLDMADKLNTAWIEYDGDRVDGDTKLCDLEDFEDGSCLDVHGM